MKGREIWRVISLKGIPILPSASGQSRREQLPLPHVPSMKSFSATDSQDKQAGAESVSQNNPLSLHTVLYISL